MRRNPPLTLPRPTLYSLAENRGGVRIGVPITVMARRPQTLCFFALISLIACLTGSTANAVGLGNLDIRSYLGEPLNVRVGLITQPNEEIESGCFTVVNSPGVETSVNRRDVRLTLVETKNSRYIEVRGVNSFNEPIGKLSIRAACKGESGVVRDYSLLLDPAPLLTPATVNREPAASSASTSTSTSTPSTSITRNANAAEAPRWTVYSGDTLASLARGIYPDSRTRQRKYVAALRTLNPALATLADNAPLTLNSELVLPDLKSFSGTRERTSAGGAANAEQPPASRPAPASTRKRSRTETASRKTATTDSKDTGAAAKKSAAADGFRLRVSGSEIDLSRSQGVTDEMRSQLRERFAFLDADDQTAQLLALKNNVKQIERRLNELQLKMATLPAMAGAASPPATTANAPTKVDPTPAAAALATPPAPASSEPSAVAAVGADTNKAPLESNAATQAAIPPELKSTAPKVTKMPENSGSSDSLPTWLLAGLSALAIAALAWWALNRRNPKRENSSQSIQPENDSDEFNTWANDPETASPDDAKSVATRAKHMRELKAKQAAARARLDAADKADRAAQAAATSGMADKDSSLGNMDAFTSPARDATDDATSPAPRTNPISRDLASTKLPAKSTAVFQAAPIAEAHANADATDDIFSLPLAAAEAHHPQFSANGTEAFDLDLDLDGHTNFPSNSGDQTSEDRLRRLRYMQERYPELAARTVSIDEPESVIQAARLYYEENQLGKACELLIYAVEERPQEIRFWLAQFELFRLEKMSRQFSDLADKFQLLFMHAEAWPKVVQIGYKLDAANPLFASARDLSEPETLTDGSENWLNAPVGGNVSTEHISQALVADLRTSLFAEHRVSHADFAGGPDLLNAIGERG